MTNLNEVFDICRICLAKVCLNESNESIVISEYLCSVIMECTSVQVTINDGFSKHICLNCCKLLKQFWEFCQMCRKSDAILKEYRNSLEYKRNLIKFIELDALKPDIIIEDVKTLNLDQWSETESSDMNYQSSTNFRQWSEVENSDTKIKLPTNLGQSSEADNSQSAVSLNLDESSEAIYWGTNNNLGQSSEAGSLDGFEDTERFDQNNHEIVTDESNESKLPIRDETEIQDKEKTSNFEWTTIEKKRFKCKLCPREFANKYNIMEHEMNEHNIRPPKLFNCDKCNLTFVANALLLKHLKSSLHEVGGIFKCEICSEKFIMKSLFLRHMHLNHGEVRKDKPDTNVKCKICDKEFKCLRYLKVHEKIHQPDGKKHKCEICGKRFLFRAFLRDHLATHTGERFNCDICKDSFRNYRNLRKHIKAIHNGV